MNTLFTIMVLFLPATLFGIALWYMLEPMPSEPGVRRCHHVCECECADCMEPGLRGPSRTSLD